MRPSELVAIRRYLERAVQDVDAFLSSVQARENARREFAERFRRMEAGDAPAETMGREGPVELTEEQKAILAEERMGFQLITEEQAKAHDDLPGEDMSDADRDALRVAIRGGWRESSRQAAAWLRNAGETVAADAIDVELNRLVPEPMNPAEQENYREAERDATEQVKEILTAFLKELPAEETKKRPKEPKKRGPKKPRSDVKQDKRNWEGWKASGHTKMADYAAEVLGITDAKKLREFRLSLDRHDKRLRRKGRSSTG